MTKRRAFLGGILGGCAAAYVATARATLEHPKKPALAGWTPPYTPPAPGETKRINRNSPFDVKPRGLSDDAWGYACYGAYGGGAFVEDYSAGGAFVIAGSGGHTVPANIGALIFDFEDGLFKRRDPQGGVYRREDYTVEETDGHPHYLIKGSNGVPAPCHPYNMLIPLPSALGGGPKGSVLYIQRSAVCTASVHAPGAYRMDLSSGRWSVFSVNLADFVSRGSAVLDAARKRAWFFPVNQHAYRWVNYVDLADGSWKKTQPFDGRSGDVGYQNWFLHKRLLISMGLWCFDPERPSDGMLRLDWSRVGDVPFEREAQAMPWVFFPPTGQFYKLPLMGGPKMWRLTAPSDLKRGHWRIDSVYLSTSLPATGDTGAGGQNLHNRLFYVPALRRLGFLSNRDVFLINPAIA